ncbi:MAG: ribonuclease H-like domain-containing protein [Candidatus Aenigmarchaeota archaeon]|nr:ribonuclease H-like domain-containing protein [Candidatus Aenigmarchaeota archaeon]
MLIAAGLILPNGESKIFFADGPEQEKKIIEETMELLRKYREEPIIIWYSGFDIPFFVSRAIKNGLDVSDIYDFRIIDLCKLVQENLKFASNKLDEVSKFLGIKKNLIVTGKDVQKLYLKAIKGNRKAREEIVEHCIDDLKALKEIFRKLEKYVDKWMK